MKADASFFARPEQKECPAGLDGCTLVPSVSIHCITEGMDVEVCQPCASRWRIQAGTSPLFANRCPRCSLWRPARPVTAEVAAPVNPLSGAAADAINAAMHAEGLLLDVRTRVLQRLQKDAPWLAPARPGMCELLWPRA